MTINIQNAPATLPETINTAFAGKVGFAYAFPLGDGEGFQLFSADDGAALGWSASLADASLDASLAELDRLRGESLNDRLKRLRIP